MLWFKKKKYRNRDIKRKPNLMHPKAIFKEDMALLKTPYSFEFDANHYFINHYTAGRYETKVRNFLSRFHEMGLCTFFIDKSGTLWQQFDGDRCGSHVGVARFNGKSITKKCHGVEISCPGKLETKGNKVLTWYGEELPDHLIHEVTKDQVRRGEYKTAGFFAKYMDEQQDTLAHLNAWAVAMGLPLDRVLGHDQVAYPDGRKVDPGGSLSMPINAFLHEVVKPLANQYVLDGLV